MTTATIVGKWLDPMITPETAKYLLSLKADDELAARLTTFAEKANEGQLTSEERREYEAYLQADSLLAILQVKARRVLRGEAAS
jgi:hypothetical protein